MSDAIKLSEVAKATSDAYCKAAKWNPETASFEVGEDNKDSKKLFASTLPEGMTIKQFEAMEKHKEEFAAGIIHGFDSLSIDQMKKDKKLDRTSTGKLSTFGRDSISLTYDRKVEYPNPQGGDKITKYGVTKMTTETRSARKVGSIKLVIDGMSDAAKEAFGS